MKLRNLEVSVKHKLTCDISFNDIIRDIPN